MRSELKTKPCEILKPTLQAIDHLRSALDRAREGKSEVAVRVLTNAINELAVAADEIHGNPVVPVDEHSSDRC